MHFNLKQFPHFVFLRELFGSHLDEGGHVMKMRANGKKGKKNQKMSRF
jgi:hypothetical protein